MTVQDPVSIPFVIHSSNEFKSNSPAVDKIFRLDVSEIENFINEHNGVFCFKIVNLLLRCVYRIGILELFHTFISVLHLYLSKIFQKYLHTKCIHGLGILLQH